MSDIDNEATLDGGDVLYIPNTRTIFVGRTRRTNDKGIQVLRKVFQGYEVNAIHVPNGLHLKSFCSFFGERINHQQPFLILVSNCPTGKHIAEQMKRYDTANQLQLIETEGTVSCNVVSIPVPSSASVAILHRVDQRNDKVMQGMW